MAGRGTAPGGLSLSYRGMAAGGCPSLAGRGTAAGSPNTRAAAVGERRRTTLPGGNIGGRGAVASGGLSLAD
jgi:hypothetical protein